jgi:hypothetical protein
MPSERLKEIFHLRAFNMEQEIWKDIPDYEGYYQVSNLGRVKSLERYVKCLNGFRINKERILKLSVLGGKYLTIVLYKNSITKTIRVHQLVCMAFLNHKPNGYKKVVDHIDNDPLNNRLDNLQIISTRHNASKDKKGTSSQYVGVYWRKNRKVWISSIRINGKLKYLGYFKNEYDAYLAYQKALNELT